MPRLLKGERVSLSRAITLGADAVSCVLCLVLPLPQTVGHKTNTADPAARSLQAESTLPKHQVEATEMLKLVHAGKVVFSRTLSLRAAG